MRKKDIFGDSPGGYKTGQKYSPPQILIGVLITVTVLALLVIIANFQMTAAMIAVAVAELISSGIPLLVVIVLLLWWIMRCKWRMFRGFV